MIEIDKSRWIELRDNLLEKIISPAAYPAFIFYFLFSIVFAGIIGPLATIYIENKSTNEIVGHVFSHIHISLAFSSYSVALLTASCTDLILSSKEGETKNSILMIGVGSLILGLCLLLCVLVYEHEPVFSYLFAIIGVGLAWFIWWISNSRHPHLIIVPKNAIPEGEKLKGNQSQFKL